MHRTLFLFRGLCGGALLALLLLSGLPGSGFAQPNPGAAAEVIYVPTGGTIVFQMKSKKPISKVENPREAVLSIRTVFGDPTKLLLTGQQSDTTRLTVTDDQGTKETYDVIVQRDVENLKTQLRRAAPTASIVPTPIADNTVILNGTVTNAEDVDIITRVAVSLGFQVINAMRVGGVQQVQLDVVIAEVSRSDLRNMTFNFLTNSKNFYFGQNVGGAISSITTAGSASGAGAIGPSSVGPLAGTVGSANVLTGVLHTGWGFLAFLEALRSESVAKIVTEPHQVVLSGRQSVFHSGGQQAIPSGGGINGVGAQFIPFGTSITCTPIVLGNGKIYLDVDATKDDLSASTVNIGGANVANHTTNSVTTSVELESGQTLVIGGIVEHTVTGSADKIPVIGDLPFFGTFFSSKSFSETETETLILVTPRFVDAQDCGQLSKILPGQETRRPDDFELFLEGILEAPRGQREVFDGNHYVPAYKNGPSAEQFPCATNGPFFGNRGSCANGCIGGCATGCNGSCGTSPISGHAQATVPAAMPATPAVRADEPRPPSIPVVPEPVDVKTQPATLPQAVGSPEGERHE